VTTQTQADGIEPCDLTNFSVKGDGELTYVQLILCAVLIGIVGGLVATAYYFVLEGMMHGVWQTIP